MATAALSPVSPTPAPALASIQTLADLLDRLGGVPLNRIRFHPSPGTAVEMDVLESDKQGLLCELVDGVLVEKAMGIRESLLACFLIEILGPFVRQRNLGLLTGEQGALRLFPGLVRIPDVAFISWDRVPNRRVPDDPIPPLAPDLAVEVLSQSNTVGEMARKRRDYFSAGVRLVWLADPRTRTIDAYASETLFTHLAIDDVLDGGAVLPGFRLPLRDWFGELDRQG